MINEEKEIKDSEKEKVILNEKVTIYQTHLSNELTEGGLGSEIKNRLANPIRLDKFAILKMKFKHFIDKIFEIL